MFWIEIGGFEHKVKYRNLYLGEKRKRGMGNQDASDGFIYVPSIGLHVAKERILFNKS